MDKPSKVNINNIEDFFVDITKFWEGFDEPIPPKPTVGVNYTGEELAGQIHLLEECIKNNNKQGVRLLTLYNQKLQEQVDFISQYPDEVLVDFVDMFKMTCSEYDRSTLKIEINNTLPYMPKTMGVKHYQNLRNYFIPALNKAFRDSNTNIRFNKAFVLFFQTFSKKGSQDLDNRFITFVFDSMRYSRIIKDDSFKHLTYFQKGVYERGVTKTEIYITDQKNTIDLLSKLI